jgi:hypothetical protein
VGRRFSENKMFGNDYGKPIAFRISTDDYEYLLDVAKSRREYKQDLFRLAIRNLVDELKHIEESYNKDK